ncbi:MAG: pyridoxal phosphate-dependent aminotransferase [Acidobacteria bacterium]|nr:pyridoxal phosphate-dependent aminotransferase [Acidobacteriota bacterium]MCA1640510.1 pyridoxal phosphate-dependent aminotransferase [Acidobacteriota bacterium]
MTKPAQNIFQTSERVARMRASATLGAMQKALALKAEGVDVVDLGAGEPDFDTPAHVRLAAQEAMSRGETKYTATGGTRALQRSIIDYYGREFGAHYEPAEVMATAGGKQAIFNAVVTLANPGDEILVAKPYWVTFPEIAKFAGATPVYIETERNGFQLTAEDVRAAVTPRTKHIIINSPSNPSGRVIPPAEFRKIMEVCAERGVYVVSDECYLRFVYPPGEVFSAASLAPELRARLCIAGSFSKTYAMTGWRIGYALAPAGWIKAMLLVQGHSTSNPNSVAQAAAAAAMNASQDCVREMLGEYARRRAWLIGALAEIPGFKCFAPEGAFYAFPDVRGCLSGRVKTSAVFAEKLLTDEHVVVTDGAGFGADGYLRISYATSLERLKEGITRIRRVAEACAR